MCVGTKEIEVVFVCVKFYTNFYINFTCKCHNSTFVIKTISFNEKLAYITDHFTGIDWITQFTLQLLTARDCQKLLMPFFGFNVQQIHTGSIRIIDRRIIAQKQTGRKTGNQ